MSSVLGEAFILIRAPDHRLSKDLQERKKNILDWISALRGLPIVVAGISGAIEVLFKKMDDFVKLGIKRTEAELRLQGVMKQMGPIIGANAEYLKDYALYLEKAYGVKDLDVMNAMSKLATNTKVVGEHFKRAMEASVNLHKAGFGPLKHVTTQVGRALQNPIQGLEALHRSGTVFTNQQKYIIMRLTRQNRLHEAQAEILRIVEQRTRGLASTMMGEGLGAYRKLNAAIERLREKIGQDLLPVYNEYLRLELFQTALQKGLASVIGELTKRTGLFIPVLRKFNKWLLVGAVGITALTYLVIKFGSTVTVVTTAVVTKLTILTGGLYALVIVLGALVAAGAAVVRWMWRLEGVQREVAYLFRSIKDSVTMLDDALGEFKLDLESIGVLLELAIVPQFRLLSDAITQANISLSQLLYQFKALIRLSVSPWNFEEIFKDMKADMLRPYAAKAMGGAEGIEGEATPDRMRGPITGFVGIGALGKRIQESVLRHMSPEERTARNTESIDKKMTSLQEAVQRGVDKPAGSLL